MANTDVPSSDGQTLDAVYSSVLGTLSVEQHDIAVSIVEPASKELSELCARFDAQLQAQQEALQSAGVSHEAAEQVLNALDPETADAAELDRARSGHREASEAMERCTAERAKTAEEFGKAKEQAEKKLATAMRDALQVVSPDTPIPSAHTNGSAEPNGSSAVAEDDEEYEALTAQHADLIIRVGGSFAKLGIKVDDSGVITKAPNDLFDSDYTILGIDGTNFYPGLQNTKGTHNVILRCKKAEILQSLSRLPSKQVQGRALKLMQVKITPAGEGFGIDLSEINAIAGVVKGGKAEAADLRVGDVIVSADSANLGTKPLVDVLQKDKVSHVFTVVRPAAFGPQDRPTRLVNKSEPAEDVAATSPTMDEDDPLKRSLAEALGNLQKSTEMLAGPTARIVRSAATDGSAITVEWAPRPDSPEIAHYHLQWKLIQDAEWTDTAASQKLKSTVVTKGNLQSDGFYQFRVRACAKKTGEWGTWCTPSAGVCPTATDDALSTIAEENADAMSTVASSIAPSAVAPSAAGGAAVLASAPPSAVGVPRASGLAVEAVQAMLADQRQALEKEHALALKALEKRQNAELEATQGELEDWKQKFLEAAGNSMQAVLEAKEETRAEVLKEVENETKAAEAMKEAAAHHVELIAAAEKLAEEAKVEAEHYKARFEKAKSEAKEETDKEAADRLNVIMRNAALEMRDKVKFVEQQTEGHIKRAVEEALRAERAKALAEKQTEIRELEEKHEKQVQEMKDVVGKGAMDKIGEIQASQDERVKHAVKEALVAAKDELAREQRAVQMAAVAAAVEETETRMLNQHALLERQIVLVQKEADAKIAIMYTDEQVKALTDRARQEGLKGKDAAVREAAMQLEQKAAAERSQIMVSVADKIRTSVRDREQQLLAEDGKQLRELAATELSQATKMITYAGKAASETWGGGNDEFEEEALSKTRPTSLLDADDLMSAPPPKAKAIKGSQASKAKADESLRYQTKQDENGDVVAPPVEYLRLKAKHELELKAMLARQEADEYHEAEDEDDLPVEQKKEQRQKRVAEKEQLKKRQLEEAMAAGKALAYEEKARMALDNKLSALDESAKLSMLGNSGGEDEIKRMTTKHPSLQGALDRVHDLERKAQLLASDASEANSLGVDRGDNKRGAAQIQDILKNGEAAGITEEDRRGLNEVMDLLMRHQRRNKQMNELLHDIGPRASETATNVHEDVRSDKDIIGTLAGNLQDLVMRESNAKLTKEECDLLRELSEELKHQQDQAEMRESQIAWLKAEAKRARFTAALEAREELERLHEEAVAYDNLVLPTAPIAAAEDDVSIAVDWLAPVSGCATTYHLQWRADEETAWSSTSASEKLKVPCCTKGHLRTHSVYQFRVRAADSKGRKGPWSQPTEDVTPDVDLSQCPTRPILRLLTKGRVEVKWEPPDTDGKEPSGYELEWRLCNGRWGARDCSMETSECAVALPNLQMGSCYTFRVRAKNWKLRGDPWTEFSPPSAPILVAVKESSSKGKGKAGKGKPAAEGHVSLSEAVVPLRSQDDASESVVMADIKAATSAGKYHPTAQAAVEAHLAELNKRKVQDAAHLQQLEDHNAQIATKAREEKLNELVRLKRDVLSRGGGAMGGAANGANGANGDAVQANGGSVDVTDTWD